MYDTEGEWYSNDIEKLRAADVPKANIWTAGSPCQNISIAGKRNGIHGERSGLFFKFAELLKGKTEEDKPEWIVVENVKGLLSSNKGFDFLEYLAELDKAGYDLEWKVFNSKDFGVPQNRERVYTIGHLRGRCERKILPVEGEMSEISIKVVGDIQEKGWYRQMKEVYSKDGLSPCLNTCGGGNLQPKIIIDKNCSTYNTNNNSVWIRKLTPKEYFRLQGFPDELFKKAQTVNSDTQLYKQAGNAVTVNVAYAIGRKIVENIE